MWEKQWGEKIVDETPHAQEEVILTFRKLNCDVNIKLNGKKYIKKINEKNGNQC